MTQVNLVLDTNIIHQEALVSARMKLLFRLVGSGYVQICIPGLVRREYVTKVIQDVAGKLEGAVKNIGNGAKAVKASRLFSRMSEISEQIDELRNDFIETYEDDFSRWAAEYRIREIEFAPESIHAVMDSYFSGAPPFRAIKERGDIIDAMISTCIDRLVAERLDVSVILKDGVFRNHLEAKGSVSVFESLDEFLQSAPLVAELARLDVEADIDVFLAVLSDVDVIGALIDHLKRSESVLDSIYAEQGEVDGASLLGFDNFGARVNGPSVGDVRSLSLRSVQYVGRQQFSYEFAMEAVARVDFCADYGDYIDFEGDPRIRMSSLSGSGVCDLETQRVAHFAGKLLVEIGGLSIEQIRERVLGEYAQFEGLQMEFEVSSAVIQHA